MYNLTIFSLSDKQASCYVWNESEGNKGSCEIATCLIRYLNALPQTIRHVILYSDTCAGQNRNQFVAAALQYAAQNIDHIEVIDQKFLESGHSHMECDSIHAAIERAKRNITIYIPHQWNTVMQLARSSQAPYTVVPLEHSGFYDFKKIATMTTRDTKSDTGGARVNWLKIKWLRYLKSEADTIFFTYRMMDNFSHLKIKGNSRRGQKPLPRVSELPRRYMSRLPLSVAKKKDLLDLCDLGVVPHMHHHYYHSLPSCSSAPDRLPEADITEENERGDE